MKKLLIALLLGSTLLCGCSKDIEIKQHSEICKEIEPCGSDLTKEELKIVEKSFEDKLFKSIFKECGIKDMEVVVSKIVTDEFEEHGDIFFIDCYIDTTELTLTELSLLKDIEDDDTLFEIGELINTKLDGLTTIILFRDIKELK